MKIDATWAKGVALEMLELSRIQDVEDYLEKNVKPIVL